ncbi:MAG: adenine-specific methyltransferase EcoRI family protein [Marinilabiliaceae bacterium]|nr:adenine-specific methyltransferase EcoRI family protein [Marinilabiliaceae bacterium]
MANTNLSNARIAKNDEFYTQFYDIEKEINAYLDYDPNVFAGKTILCPCDDPFESNFFKFFALCFQELKLKKLIATCYKGSPISNKQLSLFDDESAENKTSRNPHKIEITEIPDLNNDGVVNLYDVKLLLASDRNHLTRLEDDGDFRSEEVTKLRDEADMIVTNPPFSLFREFLTWITEANKEFLIIGNKNCITYKEVFPLFKDNKLWIGAMPMGKDLLFEVPDKYEKKMLLEGKEGSNYKIVDGKIFGRSASVWFTNLEHDRRHRPMPLMSMKDNLKFNKKIRGKESYDKYDNYDAIEVPATDAIPSDYEGVMGVPISFLDRYCPEQFEILGEMVSTTIDAYNFGYPYVNGEKKYARILIKHKK